jgi:REP element-mobilizing transposase RayT
MIGDDTYVYRKHLPHLINDDKTYFVTFVTHDREILIDAARDIVLQSCTFQDHYYLHYGMVMPDHVHLILTPHRDVSLPMIMQAIKGASAHRINRLLARRGPVWQRESFDHILRSDEALADKGEYVLNNPVRKGLVTDPRDWPWRYPK